MSQVGVILALVFSLIIAVFAILNNEPVVINYLFNTVEVSAVIVILGSAVSGAIVVFLLGVYRQIKLVVKMRGLTAEVQEREKELKELSQEHEALLNKIGIDPGNKPSFAEDDGTSPDTAPPGPKTG